MTPNPNDSNPNKHLIIPKWINEEYFTDIIQKEFPDFVRIVDFTTIAATPPGENFTSIMVRVIIEIELKDSKRQTVSYILKTSFETGESADLLNAMNLFPREKQMYETHLKRFEELYKEAGRNVKLGPKCLRVDETPERITIVLEDLKPQDFKNIDRIKGMDFNHTRFSLRKLAELHAVSAMYYELNGPYDEKFSLSFFTEINRPMFEAISENRTNIFVRAMRGWGLENVESYIEKMPHPMEVFNEALKVNTVDPNEFNVLNHGDCWANNIMFKYKENGEIDEATFIDYQMGKWGTPAQDLWYFILTSTSFDIKIKEFDHFIYIYHQQLKECLEKLKYPKHIPTLKELQIMMLKYGYWGYLTTTGTLTVVLYPSNKDANMDNFLKSGPEADEFQYKVFSNPLYAEACRQIYPFLNYKGILNI